MDSCSSSESRLIITASPDLLQAQAKKNVVDEILHSFSYGLIQSPCDAIRELVEHSSGKSSPLELKVIEKPKPVEFSLTDPNYYAQQFGSAAAMTLHFALMHKLAPGKPALNNSLLSARFCAQQTARSAALGGIYSSAFVPTGDTQENFWQSRFKAGAVGAASFSVLTASGLGLNKAGLAFAEKPVLARFLSNPVVSSGLAGIPAGIVSADLHSLLDGKGFASAKDRFQSAYTFTVVGAGLGCAGQLKAAETKAASKQNALSVSEPINGPSAEILRLKAEERSEISKTKEEPGSRSGIEEIALSQPLSHRSSSEATQASSISKGIELDFSRLRISGKNLSYVESMRELIDPTRDSSEISEQKLRAILQELSRRGQADPAFEQTLDHLIHKMPAGWSQFLEPAFEFNLQRMGYFHPELSREMARAEMDYAKYLSTYKCHSMPSLLEASKAADHAFQIGWSLGNPHECGGALALRGKIESYMGNRPKAEETLLQAIEYLKHEPGDLRIPASMFQLAAVRLKNGCFSEANSLMTDAAKLLDGNMTPDGFRQLWAEIKLMDGQIADAIVLQERALKRGSDPLSFKYEMSLLDGKRTVNDIIDASSNPYAQTASQLSCKSSSFSMLLDQKYALRIPSEEALKLIASTGPLVSLGEATGYWPALLKARGAEVLAFSNGTDPLRVWTEVKPADHSVLSQLSDRSILITTPIEYWGKELVANHHFPRFDWYKGNQIITLQSLRSPDWTLQSHFDLPHPIEGRQNLYIYRKKQK